MATVPAPQTIPDSLSASMQCLASSRQARTVRFEAGGIDENCWHLITWGESVTVQKPALLRRRLTAMCGALSAHHEAA